MESTYFVAETLDDVMHSVYAQILAAGQHIEPTKGPAKEIDGCTVGDHESSGTRQPNRHERQTV